MKWKSKIQNPKSASGGSLFIFAGLFFSALVGHAAFVYETPAEFLTSGDFNGDGIADVLVLDKVTGNARVGYQSPNGALTWSAPLATGAANLSGCGVGNSFLSGHDAVAVASPTLNRVNLVDLSNTNSAFGPQLVTTIGIGPHAVIGLASPLSPPPGGAPYLLVASSFNEGVPEKLDLLQEVGVPMFYGLFNETGTFERGNALDLDPNTPTFAVGLARGATNDTLHLWQFTNSPSIFGALSNLPPDSDYVFGRFNNEELPRFWFYIPGGTNVTIRSLVVAGAGFGFGAATTLTFTQAVEHVYIVGISNNGSAIIQFGDGIQGARLPGGSPSLAAKYSTGGGAAGNVTGAVPLDNGRFALLRAPTGAVSSLLAQVMTFDGTNYTQISSNAMSALTTRTSHATVWLFQNEPLVNPAANLVASINAPDWTSAVNGLPGSLAVRVETDGGLAPGLGTPATNNYAPQGAVTHGLPDQYRDDISLFSYAAPRAAEAIDVTISPPPGIYDGSVVLSFVKQNPSHIVSYRVGGADAWHTFTAPFALTHNATVQFYARTPSGSSRSPLHFATYTLGSTGESPPPPLVLTNSAITNLPPGINTNFLQVAARGTVFYSRHSALAELDRFQGPSPYLSFSDSPFNAGDFTYFYLENFEDSALNTPGATPSAGWIVATTAGGGDSVDPGGRSFYSNGQTNLTITFNAAALGGKLPTHVGIVWTDVGFVTSGVFGFGNVRFTARDVNGVSLGTNVGVNLGDGSSVASQAEDRFFGVVHPDGISSISVTMTNSADWEVDHLQYGYLSSAGFNDSIWAINLDGSGETFITEGARPRVTRDGQLMAFLREGGPVTSQGNLWVRDLSTGLETRFFTNTDAIAGFDWNEATKLVFDNACVLLARALNGPVTQLPLALTPECYNGAPVVNPADGRLAFHNVNPSGPQGVYVTLPDWFSRSKLPEPTTLRLRWPAWSPDGSRLAMADRTSSAFINTGVNLWTAAPDGSNLRQITALSEPTGGFPRGAIWTPDGRALVGAGSIGGTNGLWLIPLGTDGGACHCPPLLLPTSPGDAIDFTGSIVSAPQPAITKPGLFIRVDPNAVVVYWSTNFEGFSLEATTDLSRGNWTSVSGPYFLAGGYYEHRKGRAGLQSTKFFRLHYPGIIFLTTTSQPQLSLRVEPGQVVLNWPVDNVGFVVETAISLSPPVMWQSLAAPYVVTNGVFEFRTGLVRTQLQQYFRLRGP